MPAPSIGKSALGRYGQFGGQYVAPPLLPILRNIFRAFAEAEVDSEFRSRLLLYLQRYVGRPTPIYLAESMTDRLKGAKIYLKREDLTSTGGNYVNSVLGQCLLAKRMGFNHVIADTGSGHNGVATAAVAAKLKLKCTIFMGETDVNDQTVCVAKMLAFGADVRAVALRGASLHEAMSAAFQFWMSNGTSCFYVAGGPVGPHPYPTMVRNFQSVIGREVRSQLLSEEGGLPDVLLAPLGGGSSALGLFAAFLGDPGIRMVVAEGAGEGLSEGKHAIRLLNGKIGVLHGAKTYVLQDTAGQILQATSAAAGLRYPAVAPEIAALHQSRRIEAMAMTDHEAKQAQERLAAEEGILASLESSHALAAAEAIAPLLDHTKLIVVTITSGGEKDLARKQAVH